MSAPLPVVASPVAPQSPALDVSPEHLAEHLTAPQNEVLAALIAGSSVKDAAQASYIHRSTVHRWMTDDPLFRAAYNAWQHEARESAKAKLLSLTQGALDAVTRAVASGNPQVAYKLLKDLGLLTKVKEGLTDPALIQKQIQLEHANQIRALAPQPAPTSEPTP